MHLLTIATLNRLADMSANDEATVNFMSTTQPSVLTSPNDLNKQIAGTAGNGHLSDESMKQIKSYRAYKKKKEEKDSKDKRKKATPVMPESLKKDIRRAKTIQQDDIAPTV